MVQAALPVPIGRDFRRLGAGVGMMALACWWPFASLVGCSLGWVAVLPVPRPAGSLLGGSAPFVCLPFWGMPFFLPCPFGAGLLASSCWDRPPFPCPFGAGCFCLLLFALGSLQLFDAALGFGCSWFGSPLSPPLRRYDAPLSFCSAVALWGGGFVGVPCPAFLSLGVFLSPPLAFSLVADGRDPGRPGRSVARCVCRVTHFFRLGERAPCKPC